MKISVTLDTAKESVQIDFDKTMPEWKSQNYGQFTPDGVYLKEIDRALFVKRLAGRPLALGLLRSHLAEPCCGNLPRLYAVEKDHESDNGFGYYLFYEQLEGVTLNALQGEIGIGHCHEILSGVFTAIRSIIKRGYWHCDLDIKNVFVGRGRSGESVRLIDIDSCMPLSLSFKDYLSDSLRRPNINERYWSYIVPRFNGQGLEELSGISLGQAAFIYFAVDLFFFIKYPENRVSLKPDDLSKIMSMDNDRYFSREAKKFWRIIHLRILSDPGKGASWRDVDRFVTLAYRFSKSLSGVKPAPIFGVFSKAARNICSGLFGRSKI